MEAKMKKENIILTICLVAMCIALGCLFAIARKQEQQQLDALANLHAKELELCWHEIEDGQICKIEYIYDRTNTPVSAKVMKIEVQK